jgi:phosphoserine aminotransferase
MRYVGTCGRWETISGDNDDKTYSRRRQAAIRTTHRPEACKTAKVSKLEDIKIPVDLLPRDKRFCSGPSKVRQEAVHNLSEIAPTYLGFSHRQPRVKNMIGRLRTGMAELFQLPDGYEVALGNGGTNAFWDALIFNFIENKSQHLSFGEFSNKFAKQVQNAPFLDAPEVIKTEPSTHPRLDPNDGIDTYALTHNETSSGVKMEVARPHGARGLVTVDATSAAGGMRVDPNEFDVYYFSPQKCFAADGGLWISLLSPAALERIEKLDADSTRWIPESINIQTALENSRADTTYNTPALATIYFVVDQVEWMLKNGGLEWTAGRCEESSQIMYSWAEQSSFATPFVSKPDDRSPVTATINLDESINFEDVVTVLNNNGISGTDPYRALKENQLRIATFPAIEPADVEALTKCIDYVVENL